jgi:hypothetical protein
MITYTRGLTLKTQQIITKNDIIIMCNLLNSNNAYFNSCEFEPEAITEGGIVFKFKDSPSKWYKSVRLCVNNDNANGKWYHINENVMTQWTNNNDIIFQANTIFTIFLKSFHEAPLFTINELEIWEECFKQIGIVKIGKYPNKKDLYTDTYPKYLD